MLSFYSSEPTARIEPSIFMAHFLGRRGWDAERLGFRDTVLVTFIPELERRLLKRLNSPAPHDQRIQRLPWYNPAAHSFSAIASPMGAPAAVMLLEQLIALGARRFVYLGFCGALDPTYHIGDCFVPTTAWREEGSSYHYLPADVTPTSSERLNVELYHQAQRQGVTLRTGPIWTTDALFRETAQKIQRFQTAGAQAVDMEMSALFAVAQVRKVEVCAALVVSDECYHSTWKPGFGHQPLRQACDDAIELCIHTADRLARLADETATETN